MKTWTMPTLIILDASIMNNGVVSGGDGSGYHS